MKKNNVMFIVVISLFLFSCASISNQKNSFRTNFELIRPGQTEVETIKQIGPPSETRFNIDSESLIYNNNDEYKTQKGAVLLDSKTKTVKSITIIPKLDADDSKIDYLKNQKYLADDYLEIPLGRCKRDYHPRQKFFVSQSKGILIEVDSLNNSVESYSITSPEYANEFILKIKNCEL